MATDLMTALDNVAELPGAWVLPELLSPAQGIDKNAAAEIVSPKIVELLSSTDDEQMKAIIDEIFHEEGFWRDQVCLTWSLRTFHKRE